MRDAVYLCARGRCQCRLWNCTHNDRCGAPLERDGYLVSWETLTLYPDTEPSPELTLLLCRDCAAAWADAGAAPAEDAPDEDAAAAG